MARMRKLQLSILNIKIGPPHSADNYVRLMELLNEYQPEAKLYGDRRVKFIRAQRLGTDLDAAFIGEFYSFTELQGPWLDMDKLQPLLDEDGNPITPVRDQLKPNMKSISFVFYPKGHRLFYISNDGPSVTRLYSCLYRMFNTEPFRIAFGEVFVEVEKAEEGLERIWQIPVLTKVNIDFTIPNPDCFGHLTQKLQDELMAEKVKRIKVEKSANKERGGLSLNHETAALMAMADSNGKVNAEGYVGEEKVFESTERYPRRDNSYFDPREKNVIEAMLDRGRELIAQFMRR